MRTPTQILALTFISLRSIPQRLGNSLVIVVGIAGVVAVLASVLAMYTNFRQTITADGREDRALVLSRSASAEYDSSLSPDDVAAIGNAAGVRHDGRNRPLMSQELLFDAPVARKRDHSDVTITLRGVSDRYFDVRPELKLIAGRMVHSGTQELLVGQAARSQFADLDSGKQVRLQGGDWTIVGVFAGGNGARESELIGDAQTLMSAYRQTAVNTVTVVLQDPGAVRTVQAALDAIATLTLRVQSEPEYLATASGPTNRILRLVTYAIGSIMALGALFAAVNSMHSAVAARKTEIATLRAIGFVAVAVALAVLTESLLLALLGAAAGVAIAYAALNGAVISTLGGASFNAQLVYSLAVTAPVLIISVALATILALLGGALPAVRAARASVTDALRET